MPLLKLGTEGFCYVAFNTWRARIKKHQADCCREAEALKEREMRSALLAIATKAALAQQELHTINMQRDGQRLGTVTIGISGHMGMIWPWIRINSPGLDMPREYWELKTQAYPKHRTTTVGWLEKLRCWICPCIAGLKEDWEDGPSFQTLRKKQQGLAQQREHIEFFRKVRSTLFKILAALDALWLSRQRKKMLNSNVLCQCIIRGRILYLIYQADWKKKIQWSCALRMCLALIGWLIGMQK